MSRTERYLSDDPKTAEQEAVDMLDAAVSIATHTRRTFPVVQCDPLAFGLSPEFAALDRSGRVIWELEDGPTLTKFIVKS